MKSFSFPLLIVIMTIFDQCDSVPKTVFDAPFQKSNKDLSSILGKNLTLKTINGDTFQISIYSTKNSNLIVNEKTQDTIFLGRVSKSRGLLYFSTQLDSVSFWIHAVKIKGDKIYGLEDSWEQMYFVTKRIVGGNYDELIKEKSETKVILHPKKSEMKKLYASFLDSLEPLMIVQRMNYISHRTLRN